VPICGTTTISGTSSGYIRIAVPEGGAQLLDENIHIQGTGDFVGIALTADRPYLTAPECGTTPAGAEVTRCPNGSLEIRGLVPETFALPSRFVAAGPPNEHELPCAPHCSLGADVYRLYLLADGGPVTVSIEFPGLHGSVELAPVHPVHYDARVPDPAVAPTSSHVHSAGFTDTLPTPGAHFVVVGAKVSAEAGNDSGACHYLGDPGDPRLAYQPGCPGQVTGADTFWTHIIWAIPGVNTWSSSVGFAWPVRPGKSGAGGYVASAGLMERASVGVFQLAFDPSP
jgi:hypothetical protein